MIELDTKDWPLKVWYEIIYWCLDTFGPCKDGEWMWHDDYSIQISERNLIVLKLRWE